MSLITLTSKDSPDAYNFDSYFPQPIKIDKHSQVCVLKFIHYKDNDFIINETNNTLLFVLGNGKNDSQRLVKLERGNYEANDLSIYQNVFGLKTLTTLPTKGQKLQTTRDYSPSISGIFSHAVISDQRNDAHIDPQMLRILREIKTETKR